MGNKEDKHLTHLLVCKTWENKQLLLKRAIVQGILFLEDIARLQLGQEDEGTLKEVDTKEKFTYSREQSGRVWKGGERENWVRLENIEMSMVMKASVMLLSLELCW